ncbi:TRAP transporter small permease [Halalkalibacter oceani]|uniref:TRAP transporter small permease n=1 Tax=Halalkalibacter oceani TaxID=1653776 RepID=UPI00339172CC
MAKSKERDGMEITKNESKKDKIEKIVRKSDSAFYRVEKVFLFFAVIALIGMLTSMLFGIGSRVMFNRSILWVTDFSGYAMVYVVFLAAPWILKEKGHVIVDIITGALSKKFLRVNSIIICTVSIFICILLLIFSAEITMGYYLNNTVMLNTIQWPKFALFLPIVIGFLMLGIRFFIELLKSILLGEDIFDDRLPEM